MRILINSFKKKKELPKVLIFTVIIFRGKLKQESDVLKTCLKRAQDDITTLLEEKRKLLDKIRSMQVILSNFSFSIMYIDVIVNIVSTLLK